MQNLAEKIEPEFQYEEPFLYHNPNRPGFFSILTKPKKGKLIQRSYKLKDMEYALSLVDPNCDVWISQSEFFTPNRRASKVWRIPACFVDLDTYNIPYLNGYSAEELCEHLLFWCDERRIPAPSVVVYSGRGLQAKWLLEEPIPKRALPRWKAVQNELCYQLEMLGADANALDVSRVLRLVGTTNTKSGEIVRVVHKSKSPGKGGHLHADGHIVFDFGVLADIVLPLTREELESLRHTRDEEARKRKADEKAREKEKLVRRDKLVSIEGGKSAAPNRPSGAKRLIPSILALDRLADIRRLVEMRGWKSGIPPGKRDIYIFICACLMSHAAIHSNLLMEVTKIAAELSPTWTYADVRECVSSVMSRAKASQDGKTVEFDGRDVDPKYKFKNSTLIEWLEISPDEEREMKTIVSKNEGRRRDRERKRIARKLTGAISHEQRRLRRNELSHQAKRLKALGKSFASIAAELAISYGAAYALCKE